MTQHLALRFRVDFGAHCSVGLGKIELLEGIARTGSLSQAAREMQMSYRRAWLLLADLNQSFDQPVATSSAGGRGGGGASLTRFGEQLVAGYRELEAQMQPMALSHLKEFGKRVNSAQRVKIISVASIKRRNP